MLLGYLGTDPHKARAAVDFAGGGRVLTREDLAAADLLMIAVQDDRLLETAQDLAGAGFGGLAFHVSGAHDLSPLEALAKAGARIGSLHPLSPAPDPETGHRALEGQPAVVEAEDPEARNRLQDLARKAGLLPVVMHAGDRLLYHTACVLAANGLTAFCGLLEDLFARAFADDGRPDIRRLPAALMSKALATCQQHGATAALSGPVPRGDAELVRRQLAHLAQTEPDLAEVYRLLMTQAVAMAAAAGLDPAAAARLRAVLGRRRG